MPPRQSGANRAEVIHVRVTTEQRDGLRRVAEQDGATESEVLRRLLADELRRRQAPKGKR